MLNHHRSLLIINKKKLGDQLSVTSILKFVKRITNTEAKRGGVLTSSVRRSSTASERRDIVSGIIACVSASTVSFKT